LFLLSYGRTKAGLIACFPISFWSSHLLRKEDVMKEKELRRNLAVFPIGSVMKLTDLTARQIRYYEDQQLITPERTEGNRRMYSLNDMDRLLEIKDYISEGYNIAAIKRKYAEREAMAKKPVSAKDVRRALHNDIVQQSRFASSVPTFGQLKRP